MIKEKKMTLEEEITKALSNEETTFDVKSCWGYDECGNVVYQEKTVHYPELSRAQRNKLSSSICNKCLSIFNF